MNARFPSRDPPDFEIIGTVPFSSAATCSASHPLPPSFHAGYQLPHLTPYPDPPDPALPTSSPPNAVGLFPNNENQSHTFRTEPRLLSARNHSAKSPPARPQARAEAVSDLLYLALLSPYKHLEGLEFLHSPPPSRSPCILLIPFLNKSPRRRDQSLLFFVPKFIFSPPHDNPSTRPTRPLHETIRPSNRSPTSPMRDPI